jgi:hypothetical protein
MIGEADVTGGSALGESVRFERRGEQMFFQLGHARP